MKFSEFYIQKKTKNQVSRKRLILTSSLVSVLLAFIALYNNQFEILNGGIVNEIGTSVIRNAKSISAINMLILFFFLVLFFIIYISIRYDNIIFRSLILVNDMSETCFRYAYIKLQHKYYFSIVNQLVIVCLIFFLSFIIGSLSACTDYLTFEGCRNSINTNDLISKILFFAFVAATLLLLFVFLGFIPTRIGITSSDRKEVLKRIQNPDSKYKDLDNLFNNLDTELKVKRADAYKERRSIDEALQNVQIKAEEELKEVFESLEAQKKRLNKKWNI